MEINDILPIFSSDASISRAILVTDYDDTKDKIDLNAPVSVFDIIKNYDINPLMLLEDSFTAFITSYKNAQKLDKQLIFGIRLIIAANSKESKDDSLKTESLVNVWIKNSQGYNDLLKLYSAIHADKERYIWNKGEREGHQRGDWKLLQRYWTNNLILTIPFYSSFLDLNLLRYSHHAIPELGKIKPLFHIENHQLPFDKLIKDSVINYCKSMGYEILNTHQIYYYKNIDVFPMQIMRSIISRNTFDVPNLNHFSSNQFSFESYLNKIGAKLNE